MPQVAQMRTMRNKGPQGRCVPACCRRRWSWQRRRRWSWSRRRISSLIKSQIIDQKDMGVVLVNVEAMLACQSACLPARCLVFRRRFAREWRCGGCCGGCGKLTVTLCVYRFMSSLDVVGPAVMLYTAPSYSAATRNMRIS
jgi:hypothetical protein